MSRDIDFSFLDFYNKTERCKRLQTEKEKKTAEKAVGCRKIVRTTSANGKKASVLGEIFFLECENVYKWGLEA